ncbi:Ldh family oxidoreductase [Variovorax sp. OV329]|uniref:Ldh family oxidoreductase n=1 Tax=Variovorax sp. OV329 TaxID=1882825 RepID=UPI0008E04FF6|nr:Ldh family oxidoreductase [Variovorax sp. OV329]SFN52087.1 (2R)-3-sulfolactate dehydrogenase (NADP+) [Variovorax sp. OV329]
MSVLGLHEVQAVVEQALRGAGASPLQASSTARALTAAEAQGLSSHGLSRVAMYAGHLAAGRVDGSAQPRILPSRADAAVLVDAADGFAFPACELAVREAAARAKQWGIAVGAVTNSHHFGAAAYHLEPIAQAGLVGLAFGNSPAAMPAAGGRRPLFGTNPIAAVFPRAAGRPIVVDLSLSEVARGKLLVAARKGESIPLGWALDADGVPTTDPAKGLQGAMLPAGGTKGAMLALVVELLVSTLTGAHFGAEADSFFEQEGNRPRLGQVFLAIDPAALAGRETYLARVEELVRVMLLDAQVRVPGERRDQLAQRAERAGIALAQDVLEPIRALAQRGQVGG